MKFEQDIFHTAAGDIVITFIGHGSLMIKFGRSVVHIDPFGEQADYAEFPKADLILLTHEHFDHMDVEAISRIRGEHSLVIHPKACSGQIQGGRVMNNGDTQDVLGIRVEAVAAYNLLHKRPDGEPFHKKGVGNGYVLGFGGKRIYIAGDTEDIAEMKQIKEVDIAFLPMNLPYTMDPEMAASAARMIHPKILYPYHYGKTNSAELVNNLADENEIEVRIRKMA